MSNELIEAGSDPTVNVVLIQPVGCEGSDHSNVKEHRGIGRYGNGIRVEHIMFIGGPLDGRIMAVPADGRLYDYQSGDSMSPIVDRYVPSVISFDGNRRMVYILFAHIEPDSPQGLEYRERQRKKLVLQKAITRDY